MELNKYIPLDLAMINGDIVKIMAVCFNYNLNIIQNYDVMFSNGNIYKYEAESLKELPLTPEILEKNGWEFDDATWIFKKGNIRIFILLDDETYAVYLLGVRVLEFHFVHELQHFLFGLGINNNMEV